MYLVEEQQFLLRLARQSIEYFLKTGSKLNGNGMLPRALLTGGLRENRACFVALTKDFELRGCIGHLEATQPLYLDVIDNARAAACADDRFFPVTKAELVEIQIEISVLTAPRQLQFDSPDDLLAQLTVGVDGVIISRDEKNATYLPQVWDEILDKHDFLSSLCLKAGLEPDDWQKPGLQAQTYRVEIIQETHH